MAMTQAPLAAAGVPRGRPPADQARDRGSRAAPQGHAGRRDRLQADHAHRRLVSDARQAQRRPGHRARRRGHPGRRAHRRRRRAPADVLVLATGFESHGFVAPMQITGAGGGRWPRPGRACRAPTSGPASRASRTCSCSTGRTRTAAPARSSTRSRPAWSTCSRRSTSSSARTPAHRGAPRGRRALRARAARRAGRHGLAHGLHELVRRRAGQRPQPVAVEGGVRGRAARLSRAPTAWPDAPPASRAADSGSCVGRYDGARALDVGAHTGERRARRRVVRRDPVEPLAEHRVQPVGGIAREHERRIALDQDGDVAGRVAGRGDGADPSATTAPSSNGSTAAAGRRSSADGREPRGPVVGEVAVEPSAQARRTASSSAPTRTRARGEVAQASGVVGVQVREDDRAHVLGAMPSARRRGPISSWADVEAHGGVVVRVPAREVAGLAHAAVSPVSTTTTPSGCSIAQARMGSGRSTRGRAGSPRAAPPPPTRPPRPGGGAPPPSRS